MDQQSLIALSAANNQGNKAIARGNIGAGWLALSELAQARRELEERLRLLRINGDQALEVRPMCALATLALWQGDEAHALVQARAAVETAVAVQARDPEVAALCRLGDAESALGRHAAAAKAFRQAQERATEIASPYRHDAAAGLAQVAVAQGDREAALQALEPVLALDVKAWADANLLEGAEFPRLVEWTCHRALASTGDNSDTAAAEWLTRAHDALQARAASIPEPALRQGFLNNIPFHREIIAAWATRNRGDR